MRKRKQDDSNPFIVGHRPRKGVGDATSSSKPSNSSKDEYESFDYILSQIGKPDESRKIQTKRMTSANVSDAVQVELWQHYWRIDDKGDEYFPKPGPPENKRYLEDCWNRDVQNAIEDSRETTRRRLELQHHQDMLREQKKANRMFFGYVVIILITGMILGGSLAVSILAFKQSEKGYLNEDDPVISRIHQEGAQEATTKILPEPMLSENQTDDMSLGSKVDDVVKVDTTNDVVQKSK